MHVVRIASNGDLYIKRDSKPEELMLCPFKTEFNHNVSCSERCPLFGRIDIHPGNQIDDPHPYQLDLCFKTILIHEYVYE